MDTFTTIVGNHLLQGKNVFNRRNALILISEVSLPLILLLMSGKSSNCFTELVKSSSHRRVMRHSFTLVASTSVSTHEDHMGRNGRKRESVAVIGGGVSGLSCAIVLSKSGNYDQVSLFDTGRLRPGGRCSSRFPNDSSGNKQKTNAILSNYIVDHAAQMIAVSPSVHKFSTFVAQLHEWEGRGIVQRFDNGSLCEIIPSKQNSKHLNSKDRNCIKDELSLKNNQPYIARPLNQTATTYYYGSKGMGSIPLALLEQCKASNVQVHQNVWVSPDNGVRFINLPVDHTKDAVWKVQIRAKQKLLGTFDRLVIAHNGKCADRLMSKSPAKEVHALLRVVFSSTPATRQQKMTLNSIYSLTFCVKKQDSPFTELFYRQKHLVSAFVRNHPNLSFLSCQSRKYPVHGLNEKYEVWTALSSSEFARTHKAPQENLPQDVVESVTRQLLTALEESLDLSAGCLSPYDADSIIVESQLQLWGAAVPLNVWNSVVSSSAYANVNQDAATLGFLYDGLHGVGVCGDWLLDASIAGAWESGRRLAEYMVSNTNRAELVGVKGNFQPCNSVRAGIGSLR
jgi:predicted NAD/FAD-dependent oxidoreductase